MARTNWWVITLPTIGMIFILFLIGKMTIAKNIEGAEKSVYAKLSEGRKINYLIVGDSIGRGSGVENVESTWFKQLEQNIDNTYDSKMKRFSIVQSGATAFEGIVKFQKEQPADMIDLAFIVFGENDRKYMNANQFSYFYETLIRKVKTAYPQAELFTITESCLAFEDYANEIDRISEHYNAVNVDMRLPFARSELNVKQLTRDMVHPNEKGYQLYSDEISLFIKKNINDKKAIPVYLPQSLNEGTDVSFRFITSPMNKKGFTAEFPYHVGKTNEDYLEFEFEGTSVGVKALRAENGGTMEVYIDEKFVTTVSTWWPFKRERFLYLASDLDDGLHHIKFIPTGTSSKAENSREPIIKLSSIIVSANP